MSRLIDADDLPISYIDITDVGYYVSKYGQGIPVVYLEDIKDAPTIEPRKKGKWIPMYAGQFTGGAYWFECSDCGRVVPDVRNGGWNFCPTCGADMRGGNNATD